MKTGSFQNLACRKDKMNKNNFSKIAEKRGAMEMSMGTLVTIVLLMTALILGLVMVRTIFFSATDNINQIDQAVKNEITKLFSEDNNKKVVIYPSGRQITIKKGNDIDLGFAFSIRNIDVTSGSFHYDVKVKSIENKKSAAEKIDSALPNDFYLSSLIYFIQKNPAALKQPDFNKP